MNHKFMPTDKKTYNQILHMLDDNTVSSSMRDYFTALLPNCTETELLELKTALSNDILARQSMVKSLNDFRVSINKHSDVDLKSKHPLYSWTLPKVQKLLQANVVSYVRDGIDIREEYELYVLSQRDLSSNEDLDLQIYDIKDIREAFIKGMETAQETIATSSSQVTLSVLLKNYGFSFPAGNKKRGGFERTQFIDNQKIKSSDKKLMLDILDSYDHIVYTDAIIVTPEVRDLLETIKKMPLDDETDFVPIKKFMPQTALSLPANEPLKAAPISRQSVIVAEKSQSMESMLSRQSRLFFADVEAEVKKLVVNKISDDMLTNALHQGVLKGESVAVLSLLKLLAQNNKLNLLLADKRLVQMLAAVYRRQGNKQAEQLLATDPANISHLAAMLKYVLIDRLKISNNDAAWIAADLIGLEHEAGGQTPHMAYFDEATQKFAWV